MNILRSLAIVALSLAIVALVSACGSGDTYLSQEVVVSPADETVFSGVVYFAEVASGAISGPVELLTRSDGTVDVSQASNAFKLRSQNHNGTYGTHPRISGTRVKAYNNGLTINWGLDVTYAASDDLEEDGTSTDLGAGKHYTVYNLTLREDGRLQLNIKIHDGSTTSSGGINWVVIDRSFIEVL